MWLLSALGVVRKAAQSALSLVTRYPLQCAIIVTLALSGWLWLGKRDASQGVDAWKHAYSAQNHAFEAVGHASKARAIAAKLKAEAHYRTLAHDADEQHETALADARDSTERFIANSRLRSQGNRASCSGPVASAEDSRASIPEAVSANAVMVAESDVRACGDLYAYSVKAREWALSLDQ